MAALSEDGQISRSNSLRGVLDESLQLYSARCDELGIGNSINDIPNFLLSPGAKITASFVVNLFLYHPVSKNIRSPSGYRLSDGDIAAFNKRFSLKTVDLEGFGRLVKLILSRSSDPEIWTAVFDIVPPTGHPTTPPPTGAKLPSIKGTPHSFNTGSLFNTSEPIEKIQAALRHELNSSLELNHPKFIDTFLKSNSQVDDVAAEIFDMCRSGPEPVYNGRWGKWKEVNEPEVQQSFERLVDNLINFLDKSEHQPPNSRRFVASPNISVPGVVKRKPDIVVAAVGGIYPPKLSSWRQVLIATELKGPNQDNREKTWLSVLKYVREIFRSQDSRRFILGFTLSGSIMRLWEFDRLGATSSEPFDIHEHGLFFVKVLLNFLWMDNEQLGFDPDLMPDGQQSVKVTKDGVEVRLKITGSLRAQASCIAGRATTCWKATREEEEHSPSPTLLVVKDSWQFVDRPEEGELLCKAAKAGVTNIASYYHHETVHFNGMADYVSSNVRKGMSADNSTKPFTQLDPIESGSRFGQAPATLTEGERIGQKRPFCQVQDTQAALPASKRRSKMPASAGQGGSTANDRVRRRVITQRVGKALTKASCPAAILTGLLGGVKGHESLYDAKILHRDISLGNILLDEDERDGFLIDLDLAIDLARLEASGAPGKTGTKVFMAIGLLLDDGPHTFMHDLESFFWVLLWICVHCDDDDEERNNVHPFEDWNYNPLDELAIRKKGLIANETDFDRDLQKFVTPYCWDLIPCLKQLRGILFPGGQRWKIQDRILYSRIKAELGQAIGNLTARVVQ